MKFMLITDGRTTPVKVIRDTDAPPGTYEPVPAMTIPEDEGQRFEARVWAEQTGRTVAVGWEQSHPEALGLARMWVRANSHLGWADPSVLDRKSNPTTLDTGRIARLK